MCDFSTFGIFIRNNLHLLRRRRDQDLFSITRALNTESVTQSSEMSQKVTCVVSFSPQALKHDIAGWINKFQFQAWNLMEAGQGGHGLCCPWSLPWCPSQNFPIDLKIFQWKCPQALNFALEGAWQFSSGKGHFHWEDVSLYLEPCRRHHSKSTGHHCECRGLFRALCPFAKWKYPCPLKDVIPSLQFHLVKGNCPTDAILMKVYQPPGTSHEYMQL